MDIDEVAPSAPLLTKPETRDNTPSSQHKDCPHRTSPNTIHGHVSHGTEKQALVPTPSHPQHPSLPLQPPLLPHQNPLYNFDLQPPIPEPVQPMDIEIVALASSPDCDTRLMVTLAHDVADLVTKPNLGGSP